MTTKTWGARAFAAAAALGLVIGLGTASAGAGSSRTIIVDPATVAPGEAFTVSGVADCITGDTLTITVVGLGLSQQVSGDNPWSLDFKAPADAAPATYPVTVSGEECTFGDSTLVVTGEATTTTTTAPATTTTAGPADAAATAAAPAFTG